MKNIIPLEVSEEAIQEIDSGILLEYVRQMFHFVVRLKEEAQTELEEKKENQCGDYEPQLQKLEAEIREHIKVKQKYKQFC